MIHDRLFADMEAGIHASSTDIRRAVHQPGYSRIHHSARAHRTWFNGNIKGTFRQTPSSQPLRPAAQRQDLRMRRRVIVCFSPVMRRREHGVAKTSTAPIGISPSRSAFSASKRASSMYSRSVIVRFLSLISLSIPQKRDFPSRKVPFPQSGVKSGGASLYPHFIRSGGKCLVKEFVNKDLRPEHIKDLLGCAGLKRPVLINGRNMLHQHFSGAVFRHLPNKTAPVRRDSEQLM